MLLQVLPEVPLLSLLLHNSTNNRRHQQLVEDGGNSEKSKNTHGSNVTSSEATMKQFHNDFHSKELTAFFECEMQDLRFPAFVEIIHHGEGCDENLGYNLAER